jgi:CBS domain-containing protein
MPYSATSVPPEWTVEKADQILIKKKFSRRPVVDDENHLLGVVDRADIIHLILKSSGTTDLESSPPRSVREINPDITPSDPIASIMTPLTVSVTPEISLHEAVEELIKHQIRGVVVVEEEGGKLAGVVSDYDLLGVGSVDLFTDRMGSIFPKPKEEYSTFKQMRKFDLKRGAETVGEVMTKKPISIAMSATLNEAISTLVQKKVARLPVIDSFDRCVGVLTRGRVIEAMIQMRKNKALGQLKNHALGI